MSSPTQRSLKLWRNKGWTCQVVEHWNVFSHIRQDLFHFIDIVGIGNGQTIGIQTTSRVNLNARIKKIINTPESRLWLECGNKLYVDGWSKKGKVGKRKLWQCQTVEITLKNRTSLLN